MLAVILASVLRAAAQSAPSGPAASEAWMQDVCTATDECVACTAEPSQVLLAERRRGICA